MFVADLRGALVRRWYAVLACLLLTGGLVVAGAKLVHASYQAQAWVLLLPPQSSVPTGSNPYLALGGLSASAQVVSRAMTDDTAVAAYKAAGVTSEFTVGSDVTTSAPVILVTAANVDAARARADLDVIVNTVAPTLVALQTGTEVRPSAYITSRILAQDRDPVPDRKAQTRAVVAAAGLGLGLSIVLVVLLDALLLRRARPHRHLHRIGRSRARPTPDANTLPDVDEDDRELVTTSSSDPGRRVSSNGMPVELDTDPISALR
ncbi:hypothetical protein [Lapillicoccus sp.]|uniref:hypothetical protein n=1 Tax=Lapillicoccus sp. TaxID=1909287 RepID=UPI003267C322